VNFLDFLQSSKICHKFVIEIPPSKLPKRSVEKPTAIVERREKGYKTVAICMKKITMLS